MRASYGVTLCSRGFFVIPFSNHSSHRNVTLLAARKVACVIYLVRAVIGREVI